MLKLPSQLLLGLQARESRQAGLLLASWTLMLHAQAACLHVRSRLLQPQQLCSTWLLQQVRHACKCMQAVIGTGSLGDKADIRLKDSWPVDSLANEQPLCGKAHKSKEAVAKSKNGMKESQSWKSCKSRSMGYAMAFSAWKLAVHQHGLACSRMQPCTHDQCAGGMMLFFSGLCLDLE